MAKRDIMPEKLYCGTTERIAKLAPVVGLNADDGLIYLTDVYPGYFAFFASTAAEDRYGILEIDVAGLQVDRFLPSEWYLEQAGARPVRGSSRQKRLDWFHKNLDAHRAKWKTSLQRLGVCVYEGPISKKAIRKISIYDPQSNLVITEAIAKIRLSLSGHRADYERNQALTRWLVGEDVPLADWLGETNETAAGDPEEFETTMQSKWGLDIFYHGPVKPP